MPDAPVQRGGSRPVDALALERARQRLQSNAQAPWLHVEASKRMAQRLALLREPPAQVLDWWPRTGGSEQALRQALPRARYLAWTGLEQGPELRARWDPRRWMTKHHTRAPLEPAAASASLVWASMLLHLAARPQEMMAQWHRCLGDGGVLMFSTLGPGTLESLRRVYVREGWGPPMADLVDMHDLGDMLVQAGFDDPVMDQETLRLTWSKAQDALIELRCLGSNAHPARASGLRTPRWRQRLLDVLGRVATHPASSGIELEFELVYGHAVKARPQARVEPETRIGLADMRASLRASAKRPPS